MFFQHVGVAARPLETRASVVDVLAFLDLGRHRTAASSAREQAHEGVPRPRRSDARPSPEDSLDLIKRLMRDERFMRPVVTLPDPEEIARVDGIPEHPMNLGGRHATVAPRVPEADLECLLGECLHEVLPARVQLKRARNEGTSSGVDIDAMGRAIVDVADRGDTREWPCSAFSRSPFFTSSLRLSV